MQEHVMRGYAEAGSSVWVFCVAPLRGI